MIAYLEQSAALLQRNLHFGLGSEYLLGGLLLSLLLGGLGVLSICSRPFVRLGEFSGDSFHPRLLILSLGRILFLGLFLLLLVLLLRLRLWCALSLVSSLALLLVGLALPFLCDLSSDTLLLAYPLQALSLFLLLFLATLSLVEGDHCLGDLRWHNPLGTLRLFLKVERVSLVRRHASPARTGNGRLNPGLFLLALLLGRRDGRGRRRRYGGSGNNEDWSPVGGCLRGRVVVVRSLAIRS